MEHEQPSAPFLPRVLPSAAAVLAAGLGISACRTVAVVPAAPPVATRPRAVAEPLPTPVAPPVVRVGILVESTRVRIEHDAGLDVRWRPARGGGPTRALRLERATFEPGLDGRLRLVEAGGDAEAEVRVTATGSGLLRVDGAPYRGAMEIRPAPGGTLTVVNVVNLEDYLRGVVPNELSPGAFPHMEAQKAQAVAARSWALAHLGDYAARGFDVCATQSCQVYRGAASEHPFSDRAVEQTRGLVATWRGRPINAYYTSACGGHTESGQEIFDDRAPYLRGVACAVDHARRGGPAEDGARHPSPPARPQQWESRLTPAEVASAVSRYGSVGEVQDIVPRRTGVSGRVVELAVVGSTGEVVLKGLKVRWGLGLRDSLFVVQREVAEDGAVERFVITGRGRGHGVGLCQLGAWGMARAGATFDGILKHYYRGIALSTSG